MKKNVRGHSSLLTILSCSPTMQDSLNFQQRTFLTHFVWLLLLPLLVAWPPCLLAQDLSPEKIRVYTTADGLRNDFIYAVVQDREGNLWIGTSAGASRFNGKSFTNYGDEEGFSDQEVWAILADSKGRIWFGTKGNGLFRFDGKTWERFTQEQDGLPSNDFFNGFLYEDRDGNIWGGSLFMNVFKYHNGEFETMSFKGAGATEDQAGNLYVAEHGHYLYKRSIDSDRFERIYTHAERLGDVNVDQENNIWIAETHAGAIAKSTDGGQTFQSFEFKQLIKDLDIMWDSFITEQNQVWIARDSGVIRFDSTQFHYYDEENGLPGIAYYSIFQDQQGHLWFATGGGLAKFDNIAPAIELLTPIPSTLASNQLAFQFKGDDGQFGSPAEDLIYEFKLESNNQWQIANDGQGFLDNLKNNFRYQLHLRVTDGFKNSTEKTISFTVGTDTGIPTVTISDRDKYTEPLDAQDVVFVFTGEDDQTQPDDLFFRYQLEKVNQEEGQEKWSQWSKVQNAPFKNLASGQYAFSVQSRDESGNESVVNRMFFTIEPIVNKPKIELETPHYVYFVEEADRPVQKQVPINQKIGANRISFAIKAVDERPEKRELTYSVFLEPRHNAWSLYRADNRYEFHDLPQGQYRLRVRAKDKQEFISLVQEATFNVKEEFDRYPKTQFVYDQHYRGGKVVGKVVHLCYEANQAAYFSYRIGDQDWSSFQQKKCLELLPLPQGRHRIHILAKNEFGIETMPEFREVENLRIPDLPTVQLTDKPAEVVKKDRVRFEFSGEDDMESGDKTPVESMRYVYRLIPHESHWSQPVTQSEVIYTDLENGGYFFQVKALDSKENESVVPAEYFFTIRVIPWYLQLWFLGTMSGAGIVLAAGIAIVITRKRTKKAIYEQRYNPYVVGEAVHDPEMFFGRGAVMQDIFQSLKQNSLCLTGERRIGKTTLLEHIDNDLEKPFFSFFCNLEAVKKEFFFSRIMQHLVNRLQTVWKDFSLDLVLLQKERQLYDDLDFERDIHTILQFLQEHYDARVSIVMCIDEIDATQDFPAKFHQSLRNVFQTYQGQVRMVSAGVSIKRGDWHLPTSPWYNFFEFKEISSLAEKDAALLITKPIQGFYKYEKSAIEFIIQKTDGKPFYIQTLCKKGIIHILDEKRHRVTLEDVQEIYDKLIRLELNREFETFWEGLSEKVRNTIIQAASGNGNAIANPEERELLDNDYNHGHRIITIHDSQLEFSTLFRDWLEINYVRSPTKGGV